MAPVGPNGRRRLAGDEAWRRQTMALGGRVVQSGRKKKKRRRGERSSPRAQCRGRRRRGRSAGGAMVHGGSEAATRRRQGMVDSRRGRASQQAGDGGGARGRRGGPPVVFDLDGGARHRRQGARLASVTAEFDPEKQGGSQGKTGERGRSKWAAGVLVHQGERRGGAPATRREQLGHGGKRPWRQENHCGDRGKEIFWKTP